MSEARRPSVMDASSLEVTQYRERWLAAARKLHPSLPRFSDLCAASHSLRESDSRQIETDLHRSSVAKLHIDEADRPKHRASLRRVLRAWCVLRPDWGYSQAMNFSAAVALVVAGNEADAFALFVALVHRLPPDFFAEAPPLRGFQVELACLTTLIEERHPLLLEAADGAVREALPLCCCKWFLNIFVDTLPLPALLAVWDLILTNGNEYGGVGAEPTDGLLRIALALLDCGGTDHLYSALKKCGPQADASVAYAALVQLGTTPIVEPDELISAARAIELDPSGVSALRLASRDDLEAADAAEVSSRGYASWAPTTPSRQRDQQHLLKLEELLRLKRALAHAADGGSSSAVTAAASSSANGAADPSSLNRADTALVDQDGCPRTNGGVGREAFGRVLLAETPMIVEAGLRVYDVLRTHSDGRVLPKVPWRELVAALATALRGSLTERLQLIFTLFDPEGSGLIDVPHMMAMASMLFKLRLLDPSAADRPIVGAARAVGSRRGSVNTTPVHHGALATPANRRSVVANRERGISAPPANNENGGGPSLDERVGSNSSAFSGSVSRDDSDSARFSCDHSARYSEGDSPAALALEVKLGGNGMSRATAPPVSSSSGGSATPSPLHPQGRALARGWTTKPNNNTAAQRAAATRYRRGSADPRPPPDMHNGNVSPRLRRVATVSGCGDRYEQVAEQVNELLQLLLVMDIDRSGSLSYEEWTRGVLSLPEVLACFQLASVVAQPSPMARLSDGFRRLAGGGNRSEASPTARANGPPAEQLQSLWWQVVWRRVMGEMACGCN